MPSQAIGLNFSTSSAAFGGGVDVLKPSIATLRAFGARHQVQRRFKDRHQRRFGADQSASDIEAIFRQQVVEVVARDAPFQLRKFLANQVAIAIDQRFERGINFARAARRRE